MKNPSEFWKDEIGDSAVNDFIPREPYIRINLEDENRVNVFNKIAHYMCEIGSKIFKKNGFLDLDDLWNNSIHPQITEWRENEILSQYETPYS